MDHGNLLGETKFLQQVGEDEPTLLSNTKQMSKYERSVFWDDDDDAVKNAQFTFIWVIVFVITLYLIYSLYAFFEKCRHKIRQPVTIMRLLRPSMSSQTADTTVDSPEQTALNPQANGDSRMMGDGRDISEFVFPPIHYRTVNGILLDPSPMHRIHDTKQNPDVEDIVVFLPLISLSPPSSSVDLSTNLDVERGELSSNNTFGSDRHTV